MVADNSCRAGRRPIDDARHLRKSSCSPEGQAAAVSEDYNTKSSGILRMPPGIRGFNIEAAMQ